MGRKKTQKKSLARVQEEHYSSVSSQASEGSADDAFENHIDNLYTKRQATRLHALQGLVSLLCSDVLQEECLAREDTLTRLFIHSVVKGKGNEPLLAARALGLLVLTLGLDYGSERIWMATRDELMKAAVGRSPEVSCAAIDAFATECFVAEEDVVTVLESMGQLRDLWHKGHPRVQEKAIRAWTLLLSSLTSSAPFDSVYESIATLRSFLDSPDLGVRKAVGEAFAVLHFLGVDDDDMTDDSCSDGMSIASSSTCFSRISAMDEAVDKMRDLSHGGGDNRRQSKREKLAQRSAFRDIVGFVEDGIQHETKIKLQHGDVLVVDDIASLIHLNFIRTLLAEGFQAHIQCNSLLHQIFNYEPRESPAAKLSRREKRMHMSPSSYSSKKRSVGRGAARNQKNWLRSDDIYL